MSSDSTPRTNLYDPTLHEEDGHGGCVICHFYVPHTDGEMVVQQWPCAIVREAASPAASGDALREAVLSGPPVHFPNLPAQPTGPDVLDAIAAWMDGVDERDGNPRHEVQDHLRDWANRLRAALAAAPPLPEGLDVERLERIGNRHIMDVFGDGLSDGRWQVIAAEYARFASREEQPYCEGCAKGGEHGVDHQ